MTLVSKEGKTLDLDYDADRDVLTIEKRDFHAESFRATHETPAISPQQRTVLGLIKQGKRNKEIAGIMNLNERTVHSHKRALMARLNIDNTADLIRFGTHLPEAA